MSLYKARINQYGSPTIAHLSTSGHTTKEQHTTMTTDLEVLKFVPLPLRVHGGDRATNGSLVHA